MLYKVLDEMTANKLQLKVISMISDGWEPSGGIAIAYRDSWAHYCQAMIKRQ